MKLKRTMKAQSPKKKEKKKKEIIIKKNEEDLNEARGHAGRISVRVYAARRSSRP